MESSRPPLPPFTEASATLKVRGAEDAWNLRDPDRVAGVWCDSPAWPPRCSANVRAFCNSENTTASSPCA